MVNDIKYHYALDEHGKTVYIDDVSDEDRKLHTYHCMSCEGAMIPRMGKIRQRHFAHKNGEVHCNSETYLHKLAKRLFKEKFDNSDTFEISYYKEYDCSALQTCTFADKSKCYSQTEVTIDLKKYYDTCNEEQPIGNFIADLLLTNSKIPDRDPILLEIQVTHECEDEKKESGLHIIELQIKDEDRIRYLLERTLKENYGTEFYGFEKKSKESKQLKCKGINRFHLYNSGKAYIDKTSCDISSRKKDEASIFEVCFDGIDEHLTFYYGYILAIQNGIITKACCLCKKYQDVYDSWYKDNNGFCWGQEDGMPIKPIQTQAEKCDLYCESIKDVDILKKNMPKYIIAK